MTLDIMHFLLFSFTDPLKSLKSENHTPIFIFLIEALGPISCKNLKNFQKEKVPKTYFSQTISGPSNSAYPIRHEYAGQSVPRKG